MLAVAAGVAAAEQHAGRGRQQTIPDEVNDIVTSYDSAFVSGHYARACPLIDPGTGMTALNSETDSVGIRGSCEARLAGAARLLGRSILTDLPPIWRLTYSAGVQVTASSDGGFIAVTSFTLPNRVMRKEQQQYHVHPLRLPAEITQFWLTVQRAAQGRALLTCPPLMCLLSGGRGRGFLSTYLSYKKSLVHRKH